MILSYDNIIDFTRGDLPLDFKECSRNNSATLPDKFKNHF